MTDTTPRFPFGSPLLPRSPSAGSARKFFVLGAYPSALHVEWKPPAPFERVQALAVDNEPEPFWTGADEVARIDAWSKSVDWKPEWGTVKPVGVFNGSSGVRVDEAVLTPLGASRADAWITDCLDTYRFSKGQEGVVASKYAPFAAKFGLPTASTDTLRHPTEDEIFNEARLHHLTRLDAELRTARPDVVITLGNAALRVFAKLMKEQGEKAPAELVPDKTYGTAIELRIGAKAVTWWPLVHPGQRSKEWQGAHAKWIWSLTKKP